MVFQPYWLNLEISTKKNKMITVRTPFRLSFFGGSTDYESFYREHGSFLIGTTIDKYAYLTLRERPNTLSKEHLVMYSKMEHAPSIDDISNPLIRETFRFMKLNKHVEFFSLADTPSRTGLGGSSSYCVGLLYLLHKFQNRAIGKRNLAKDAIQIERKILKEAGGIQDQIWPAYGGFSSIEIDRGGDFKVKPLPVSDDFLSELEESIVLIYTNEQRTQEEIAKSHEGADKKRILDLSKEAYGAFVNEDIRYVGELLFESWKMKRDISPLISTPKVDETIETVMGCGAYGAKLLGTGGCGFVMAICNDVVKETIEDIYRDSVLPVRFDKEGVTQIL